MPPDHIMYDAFQELIPVLINNMKCADLVTCTNERLANKVSKNGIIIIDNYLSYAGIKKATDEYIMENDFKIEINKFSLNAIIYK